MFRLLSLLSLLVGAAAYLIVALRLHESILGVQLSQTSNVAWDRLRHLGGISPWNEKTSGTTGDAAVPPNCIIDQVHMMARHGERYPTGPTGIRMLELYHRLKNAGVPLNGSLAFFNDWDFFAPYPVQQFDQLTNTGPFAGSLSAFTMGVQLRSRYGRLLEQALKQDRPVSFWAGKSERVIDSARFFATGFFGLDWEKFAALHIIPETRARGADTLTPGRACPKYATSPDGHGRGVLELGTFRDTYCPSISERLRSENPTVVFSVAEVFTMQEMCAFEQLVKGTSPWCEVFTHEEMRAFEYGRDLLHYYRAGPGNRFGATMGWLWLNATATLLQQGPEEAGPLFFSFNHDSDMIAMLTALDLFPQTQDLPSTEVNQTRTWRTSDVVPMGARFLLERLVCPAPQECWDNGPMYPNHVYCAPPTNATFVRVNLNDGIVPIPGCDSGPGRSCPLKDFVTRIEERGKQVGDFAEVCGLQEGVPRALTFLHQ